MLTDTMKPYIMLRNIGLVMLMLCTLGMAAGNANAAAEDKKERDAQRKLRLMMQSMEQEKAALASEKNSLSEQVKSLNKQISDLKNSSTSVSRKKDARVGELEKELLSAKEENLSLSSKLQITQGSLEDLTAKSRESLHNLQKDYQASVEQGDECKSKLQVSASNVSRQSQSIEMCEKKNMALYELNVEILDRYKKKGVWSALFQAEPFTQIKKVEMENIIQEYKEKLDSQKVEKTSLDSKE